MIRGFLLLFFAFSALWVQPADAADVWLYRNPAYISSSEVASLRSALIAEGASVTTTTSSSWPTSYAGYRVVIILLPASGFNTAQVNALDDFLEDGGRLVLAGDWEDYVEVCVLEIFGVCVDWEWDYIGFYAENNRINSLLSNLGASVRISTTLFDPGSCNSTTSIASDTLTSGVSALQTSAGMALNGGGKTLARFGGYQVLAVDQPAGADPRPFRDIVVSADVNFFTYDSVGPYCPGTTSTGWNYTLWRNLYECPDQDGDGHALEVCGGSDCDDYHASVRPGAHEYCNDVDDDCNDVVDDDYAVDASTWYMDWDDDRFGDPYRTTVACDQPSGYVTDHTDCDDLSAAINPDAVEVPYDGLDNDCSDGDLTDVDEDGYDSTAVAGGTDCDDDDEDINPAALEYCDRIDNDCDSDIDEPDAVDALTWYFDYDGDSYGDPLRTTPGCTRPTDYVSNDDDCDDTRGTVYPGAPEIPYDGLDNDCLDGDLTDIDEDGRDGYPAGGTDCDDTDASVYPGAVETPDGVDEDCDTIVDEGTIWYDDDGDGWAESGGDCDDGDSGIHPGATELPDGVDQDCDETVDEGTIWYDDDGDGSTEVEGDCNDGDADVGPAVTEVPDNGIDDDCDGVVDDGVFDEDGDGYTVEAGDCDDEDATSYPGADEVPDDADNDCDETVDEGTTWYDDDGDEWSEVDGDCDDSDDEVNPDAEEVANGLDDDCDGDLDEDTERSDDDGDGLSEEGGDCDDDDAGVHPGAVELENGVDDDCDGETDEDFVDVDRDGWTEADGDCDDVDGWVHPDAFEFCDEIDNDCDDVVDEGCGEDVDTGQDTFADLDDGAGCRFGVRVPVQAAVFLPLIALFGRRRRRRGPPAGLVAAVLAVPLLGTGCGPDVMITPERGVLLANPELVDLGTVPVGETWYADVLLDNIDRGTIDLLGLELDNVEGDYFAVDDTAELPDVTVGQSEKVTVSYTPLVEGYHHAVLTIISDAEEPRIEVPLRGAAASGSAVVWPLVLDFGDVVSTEPRELDLTVLNDGGLDLELAGATASVIDFAVVDTLPLEVPAGESRTLTVRYTAIDTEATSDSLVLDLGAHAEVPDVLLRANDCANGAPAAYDRDLDGYATCGGDCDDDDPAVHPGAVEVYNDVNDDCDDLVDEGTEGYDDDGDGFTELDGDCNDAVFAINPDVDEVIPDGIDNDCDGTVDGGSADPDGDGYSLDGGDCDDTRDDVFPGAPELPDGVDNDCDADGEVDEGTVNADDDGDGQSEVDGDCDDADDTTWDGATELPDWVDNDCDGEVDEDTVNSDDDGDGYSEIGGDCDDDDPRECPAFLEIIGDGLDNDCDGVPE